MSNSKPDCAMRKDTPANMIMKSSLRSKKVRQGPGQDEKVIGWKGYGLTCDRHKHDLPDWVTPYNILRVSTVNEQANQIRVT